MDIHPELVELYNNLRLHCPKECQNIKECLNYISCGPDGMCKIPCPKCLAWTGYGGIKTIEKIKDT